MADLRVNIGRMALKNPVMTASGTFGYGTEFADFVDPAALGGIIVKGTTLEPREGNNYPRMVETASGMLNCVGLQNKGVHYFCEHIYPEIEHFDTNIVVNVSGSAPEDYAKCAACLAGLPRIPAIELNISCPNVKNGGMAFGVTPEGAASVVRAVRAAWPRTLIVKLSPNVTDIAEIARAAEAEGADALSLINTLMGMAIDVEKRRPLLSIGTGGLSGPAVKPVALRMVWQVARRQRAGHRAGRHLKRHRRAGISDSRRQRCADRHGQLPRPAGQRQSGRGHQPLARRARMHRRRGNSRHAPSLTAPAPACCKQPLNGQMPDVASPQRPASVFFVPKIASYIIIRCAAKPCKYVWPPRNIQIFGINADKCAFILFL